VRRQSSQWIEEIMSDTMWGCCSVSRAVAASWRHRK
jgi:hypothetical protein